MNIAGLMMALTPNGMAKAMAMQQEMALNGGPGAAPSATDYEVVVGTENDGVTAVQITLRNADGEVTFETSWLELAGLWKVDDFALKQ